MLEIQFLQHQNMNNPENEVMTFVCFQCKVEYNNEPDFENHIASIHLEAPNKDVQGIHLDTKVSEPEHGRMEIISPSEDWITMNTADLREMLSSVPMDLLNMEKEEKEFDEDYLDILNKVEDTKSIADEMTLADKEINNGDYIENNTTLKTVIKY